MVLSQTKGRWISGIAMSSDLMRLRIDWTEYVVTVKQSFMGFPSMALWEVCVCGLPQLAHVDIKVIFIDALDLVTVLNCDPYAICDHKLCEFIAVDQD